MIAFAVALVLAMFYAFVQAIWSDEWLRWLLSGILAGVGALLCGAAAGALWDMDSA